MFKAPRFQDLFNDWITHLSPEVLAAIPNANNGVLPM
jgi:hypothetical protein